MWAGQPGRGPREVRSWVRRGGRQKSLKSRRGRKESCGKVKVARWLRESGPLGLAGWDPLRGVRAGRQGLETDSHFWKPLCPGLLVPQPAFLAALCQAPGTCIVCLEPHGCPGGRWVGLGIQTNNSRVRRVRAGGRGGARPPARFEDACP